MRTLSRAESDAWCASHAISLDESRHPLQPPTARKFAIPVDSGKRIYLVATELRGLRTAPEVLVWFTEWGVWHSSERPHIFERFRASYGIDRPLIETPGHIFTTKEIEDLVSYVTLGVLFLWDIYVVASPTDIVHFSHDEYGWSTQSAAA